MSNSASKWALVRIKDVAAINPATFFVDETVPFLPMSDISTKGFDVKEYKLSAEASKYSQAQKDDVLFAKVTPCFENGKGCVIDIFKAILATTEVTVLRAGKTVMPLYLRLITQSIDFKQYGVNNMKGANGLKRVTEKASGNYSFLLPSLLEQKKILNYLSDRTTTIDSKIQLLQEKSTALSDLRKSAIHQAVTKGLDLNVKMKASGVDWIGDVPAHWGVTRLKNMVTTPITDGPHETPVYHDTGVPFLSVESIANGRIDISKMRGYISHEDHKKYSLKYCPKKNDILFVKSASVGKVAIVDIEDDFNVWSPLAAIRCNPLNTVPKFLFFAMASSYFQQLVLDSCSITTQYNIGMKLLGDIFVVVPPISEQFSITAYLNDRTLVIDDSIKTITEQITALKSLRQSLIHEAVTGKINVADFGYKTT